MNQHEKDTLAQWGGHPGWEIANREDVLARDKYLHTLANKLFSAGPTDEIDQLELAFQRGRWRGRRELLNEIRLANKPLSKEGDPA